MALVNYNSKEASSQQTPWGSLSSRDRRVSVLPQLTRQRNTTLVRKGVRSVASPQLPLWSPLLGFCQCLYPLTAVSTTTVVCPLQPL